MQTQNAVFGVKTIATHQDPDIDDVVGIKLLKQYGRKQFPGINRASIVLSTNRTPWNSTNEELERRGILCVGIGGNMFDEHPFGNHPGHEGECAATLVAKHLGIENKPGVSRLVTYALEKNYSALTDHWELAPLIKLAFRYGTHSDDQKRDSREIAKIFEAVFLFLNAMMANEVTQLESDTHPKGEITRTIDEMVAGWLLKRFGEARDSIEKYVNEAKATKASLSTTVARSLGMSSNEALRFILKFGASHRTIPENLEDGFLLSDLVYLAQKHFCVGGAAASKLIEITHATEIFLEAMWLKEWNFHVRCRAIHDASSTRHETIGNGEREIKITSVLSSNPEIQKYCRSKYGDYAGVVIQRDEETGNTQIFFDKKAGLDLAPIVANIRLAERAARGVTEEISFEKLSSRGASILGADVWYFDGHQIMNGSLTTRQQPTKLKRERIEAIVLSAVLKQLAGKRR